MTEVFANPRVRQKRPGAINAGMLLLLTASLAQWTWFVVKPPLPPLVIAPNSDLRIVAQGSASADTAVSASVAGYLGSVQS